MAETRARQRHLPPVSVYRWWARRTETVTGAVIDALAAHYGVNGNLRIADPFAGGGVIALAGLLRGHRMYAQDVNPWAARCLSTMLSLPSSQDLATAADRLQTNVADTLERAYATRLADGTPAILAHTLRVATSPCPECRQLLRLYPTATVSLLSRVDIGGNEGFLACPAGHLQVASISKRAHCERCRCYFHATDRYTPGRVARCTECGWSGRLAELAEDGGLGWEVALVERCGAGRREISVPTEAERLQADFGWVPTRELPAIDVGIETAPLRRHGLTHWHDL
ncbi:MAG: hypothetical protein JO337_06355, partial [Acidimicrobiales bacterium]|nr:hypothetical protein [Acidimicrobiales bacterium]